MSLQGSLETFALPDVLVLLASTKKDGELKVTGGKVEGKVWVEKGQIVHSDVNGKETPSIDAIFELLRLDAGNFSFEGDSPSPSRHEPETIDVVLADAQVRLGEWKDIAKVVPHLDVLVDMADKAPGDQVTITAAQWKMLRAVAGGSSVASLMSSLHITEFDACRSVKELFEANLVSMDLAAKPKPAPAPAPAAAPAPTPAPAAAGQPAQADVRSGQPNGIHKRPADVPSPAVKDEKTDRRGASDKPSDPNVDRVEEVKAEVEKELAALVEQARTAPGSMNGAGGGNGAARKVRATTSGPGAPLAPEPAGGPNDGAGAKPATEETKALVAQLAALEGENEEKIAKKVEEHLARGGELPEVGEGDEPINRGLLLKFLSSVRN